MSATSTDSAGLQDWILVKHTGQILELQLNRPQKKNALTQAMYQFLADQLRQAEQQDDVHVVLISGAPEVFCAGNDILDFVQNGLQASKKALTASTDFHSLDQPPVLQFLHQLAAFSKPLIAAANGPCIGIGTTLLMHCDLVCLGEQARLQTPFVQLGLCPEAAASLLMPQSFGHQRAAELLLLGETLNAATALQWGIANRVCPADQLHSQAYALAQRLATQPQQALRLSKRLLKQQQLPTIHTCMQQEAIHFAERMQSTEAQQAFRGFLQKS